MEHPIKRLLLFIILSTKLCLDAGNNEYVILCNFGGRIVSSFKVIEGEAPEVPLPPGCRKLKKSPV